MSTQIIDSNDPAGQNRKNRLIYPALLILIVVIAAAIRLIGLSRDSLWFDELQTLWVSQLPLEYFRTGLSAWGDVPLYYVIGRFWFDLFPNDAWIRSLSWIAGTGVIVIIYFIGKELYSRKVGLWAAALAAVSPFLVWYSRDATLYSWLAASSLLSLYFLTRCITRGGMVDWGAYVFVTAATLFTHLFSVTLLVAELTFYLILRDRQKNPLAPWIASQAILACILAVSWSLSRSAQGVIDLDVSAKELLRWLVEAPIVLVGGAFGIEILERSWLNRPLFIVAAYLILAVGIIVLAVTRKQSIISTPGFSRRTVALTLYTSMLVVLPVTLYSVAGEFVFPYRFYLWASPTLMLLIALVIVLLKGKAAMVIGALAITGLAAATILGPSPPTNIDYRQLTTVVSNGYMDGDYLFCFPWAGCAVASGHYLPENLPIGGGLISQDSQHVGEVAFLPEKEDWFEFLLNQQMSASWQNLAPSEEFRSSMASVLRGTDRVWLIVDYGEDCQSCDVVRSNLLQGWKEEESWQKDTGTLYLYTREPSMDSSISN